MTLVDTSSLIHLLRKKGDPDVKERVRRLFRLGDVVICDMVAVELWMGVGSREDEANVRELTDVVPFLPIDSTVWRRARELAACCRRSGMPVPASDVLIAACAFVHRAKIDTEDAHFEILERFREVC
jgi:predicted nucleic acid-binding protein